MRKNIATLQNKCYGGLESEQGWGSHPSTHLGARYYYDTN